MPSTVTLQQLEQQARRLVDNVQDWPWARKQLREDFYRKYGHGLPIVDPLGLGSSEVAFLDWEIRRGALNPMKVQDPPVKGMEHPGSPWWRAINSQFIYFSQLAALVYEAGLTGEPVPHEVRAWLDYLQHPTPRSWYRAHNASIIRGYLDHVPEALAESEGEQLFMNEVLFRLLFAEALVQGDWLEELAADPRLASVNLIVHLSRVYPDHYPLTPQDIRDVEEKGDSLQVLFARLLDKGLILPHLQHLVDMVAAWVDEPELKRLIREGKPIYPHLAVPRPSQPVPGRKQRIAILGGGMSALAAAHELTSEKEWKERYEITVYQLGWRVGGKTATGRGPNERIEEHGIHILQGWYDNTFRFLRDVYRERREEGLASDSPLQDLFRDGLQPNNSTLITEYHPEQQRWQSWPLIFPTTPGLPGEGPPLSTWAILKKVAALAMEMLLGSPYASHEGALAKWLLSPFFPKENGPAPVPEAVHLRSFFGLALEAEAYVGHALSERLLAVTQQLVEQLDTPPPQGPDALLPHHTLLELMERAVHWLEELIEGRPSETGSDGRLLRILVLLEFAWVNLKGILEDVWSGEDGKFHFNRINDKDFREWLQGHGASGRLLRSSVVRFLYTGTFANLASSPDKPQLAGGLVAAGTALQFLTQSVGYKGSFVFQFRMGTGDTMVMPVYEVLAHRGVKFEFFQQVQALHPSAQGDIERITIGQQVTLKDGTYRPTRKLDGLRVWPSHPLYEQLEPQQAQALREGHIDLENPWADWKNVGTRTLVKGRDFDQVLLAIPVGALKDICSELCAQRPEWRAMVENVKTTATVSMQLWLRPDLQALGMNLADWGLAPTDCCPNVVVYASPLYSWLDSSLVLPQERWPAGNAPGMLAYYTGALRDGPLAPFSQHDFHERAVERVKQLCGQWLWDNMGFFWRQGTAQEAPAGLDLNLLVGASKEDVTPEQKFDSQFFRANVAPSDRYTLSLPGTAKYRLRPDASGYRNLFLAGDWTDFGVNVGYIEGAIISGLQAAGGLRRAVGAPEGLSVLKAADVA